LDDVAVDHRDMAADFVALAELPGDDAAADNVASLFGSERKILTRATENAYNALAAANRQYSTESLRR
jgi:hypothetical protein